MNRKQNVSKTIHEGRIRPSKRKIAPFLVYPTVYYDGYLFMKHKTKRNSTMKSNRPSTAKVEYSLEDENEYKCKKGDKYHKVINFSNKSISPLERRLPKYHLRYSNIRNKENKESKTIHYGNMNNHGLPACFTNNLLAEKIKETNSFEGQKGEFFLKGRSKMLIRDSRNEKRLGTNKKYQLKSNWQLKFNDLTVDNE